MSKIRFINQNNIGKIRRFLFMPFSCKWNAWVRDITAKLETNVNIGKVERIEDWPIPPDDTKPDEFKTEISLYCGMDGIEFTNKSISSVFSKYIGYLPTCGGSHKIKVNVKCIDGCIKIERR